MVKCNNKIIKNIILLKKIKYKKKIINKLKE